MGISLQNGLSLSTLDDRYVNITGDTMTGDLDMNGNKLKLDSTSYLVKNGNIVELWVNDVLSESWIGEIPATVIGSPMGLLLTLTYATT